jgi:hypothetical protein
MLKINLDYSELLIIGNGFDLNLGLKTSYNEFLQSDIFTEMTHYGNAFAMHLSNRSGFVKWIDIENELKMISLSVDRDDMESHFDIFFNAFTKYLRQLDYDKFDEKSHAYKFINSIRERNFLILDFNYTVTTKNLLLNNGFADDVIQSRLIKVHGSIDDSIIFGIEDSAQVKREHIFLKKSYHPNFKGINLFKEASKIKTIRIFGHSLGQTDHFYFDKFFESISMIGERESEKEIYLYHYGKDGYKDLHIELEKLTKQNLFGLKQNNDFIPIDTSK